MATATIATASSSSKGGENTGRWTAEEHRLFLQGLEQHGKGWKKIASLIKSRTVVQIRTHAQKYFQKLAKARQNGEEGEISMDGRGGGGAGGHAGGGAGGPGGHAGGVLALSGHGPSGHGSHSGHSTGPGAARRRRPASGTKRRPISGVVASAQREARRVRQQQGRRRACLASSSSSSSANPGNPGASVPSAGGSTPGASVPALLPASVGSSRSPSPGGGTAATNSNLHPQLLGISPALHPFLPHAHNPLPAPGQIGMHLYNPSHLGGQGHSGGGAGAGQQSPPPVPCITTHVGTISGAALEDSLFRFLTPAPDGGPQQQQVNEVARRAGAHPIVAPGPAPASAYPSSAAYLGGEVSPTGVPEIWLDHKDPPQWYSSGKDVDELLHEADALDWLSDTGDLNETYDPPPAEAEASRRHAALAAAGPSSSSSSAGASHLHRVKRSAPSDGNIHADHMPPIVPADSDPPSAKRQRGGPGAAAAGGPGASASSLFSPATEAADGMPGGSADAASSSRAPAPSSSSSSHPSQSPVGMAVGGGGPKHGGGGGDDHPHLDVDVFDAHLDEQSFVSALLDEHPDSTRLPTI